MGGSSTQIPLACLHWCLHPLQPLWPGFDSHWSPVEGNIVTVNGKSSFAPFARCFMPEMRKSKAWIIAESCLQRFYSWNSTTISSSIYDSNSYPQIRSIKGIRPQSISRGLQIILIISMPWPQLEWIYVIIHSDQTTQLSKAAWAVTFLIFPASLPIKVARHIFLMQTFSDAN